MRRGQSLTIDVAPFLPFENLKAPSLIEGLKVSLAIDQLRRNGLKPVERTVIVL